MWVGCGLAIMCGEVHALKTCNHIGIHAIL
nr:MAG TPA: hypothetical protein [Caudoviricetes sp.]